MPATPPPDPARDAAVEEAIAYAEVLTEIGELYDAEAQVAELLDRRPDHRAAMELFAKIMHMRGRLSEAIACWTQLYATAGSSSALTRLSALLQLARDPERGAGQFLAVGQFQLWRRPAADLELEEAFGHFLARKPDRARADCQRLARKYRDRDRDVYKLAVLAEAWIAELCGDRDTAVSVLEALGRERSFETDADRVVALGRLYEQRGLPEDLRRAVLIDEFLVRGGESSALGSLAALSLRLGDVQAARGYELRYLEAFRRGMHRPSFLEAVRVAARRYVPLAKLAQPRLAPPQQLPAELARRERALALALVGRVEDARQLFEAGAEALDYRYLGDLASLAGAEALALGAYLRSFASDPEDPRVIGWLLDYYARSADEAVARLLTDAQLGPRVLERLEATLRTTPLRASVWRQLCTLHRIAGRGDAAARCEERASRLELSSREAGRPVGRALAAAVFHFVGTAKGLMHEVWAGRKAAGRGRGGFLDEILGNLTPEMVQAVRNTFLSVREFARARFPHRTSDILDYGYTYKVTKEDEPSGGLSAGLPTALAFLSVFLDRPLPQDVASSGVLIADSHDVLVLGAIGEPEHKVRGAYNRNLRQLILPRANRAQVEASPLVPRAVTTELVAWAGSFDEAVTLTFGERVWLD